jgi:hypothetical protein
MKYVLDASVAVKMLLHEQDSHLAVALREEFRQQIHELIAPDRSPRQARAPRWANEAEVSRSSAAAPESHQRDSVEAP